MRLFGRKIGDSRVVARARAAELRGDLGQAAALFAQGGRLDESSRVMLLRGDGETDPAARLRHYVQAVATAPPGTPAHTDARRKHATLLLAIAAAETVTPALRQDLLQAGRDLEAIGEPDRAAEAYARIGDVEGEARALARAGDVEKLDALLLGQQGRDRETLARRGANEEVVTLAASGRRREAVATALASGDEAVRERGRALEARRIAGDLVGIALGGVTLRVVLGAEVVVGRVATIAVASAALSRQHLVVARRGGDVVVRDLGSRNGTLLRGLALAGEATVG
ncbi:MAG: FHA domain-containing protein, partial [Polyangiaceae bacterium]